MGVFLSDNDHDTGRPLCKGAPACEPVRSLLPDKDDDPTDITDNATDGALG
jgi:hypothetical protein